MSPPARFDSIHQLEAAVGSHLGFSEWVEVTQASIGAFADATGDHQWIHVDPDRAAAGPFGTTIAHGYFTLALAVRFAREILDIDGLSLASNLGTEKVRFIAPVPVGSRLRAGGALKSIDAARVQSTDAGTSDVMVVLELTFELEGNDKPACVADLVYSIPDGQVSV
jgi:acyl dehydratase